MSNVNDQIGKIIQALQEIASGNYDFRLSQTGDNDELNAISCGINMLAEEIEARLVSEQEKNQQLLRILKDLKKSKAESQESEAKFRHLVESVSEGFAIVDEQEDFVFVNQAGADIFGFDTSADLIGRNMSCFTSQEVFSSLREKTISRDKSTVFEYDLPITRQDGETRIIKISSQSLYENNSFKYSFGIFRDVTQKRKMEQEIFDSNSLLNKIINSISNVIFTLDGSGRFTSVNRASYKITGYEPEELIGKSYHILISEDNRQNVKKAFNLVLLFKNSISSEEIRIQKKDGSSLMLSVSMSPLDLDNNKTMVVGIAEDISERYKYEQALLNSEMRYKQLFDEAPISIWEEDFSEALNYIQRLKQNGITEFKQYFQENRQEVEQCSKLIRILDVNLATLRLFKARSKQELQLRLADVFTEDSLDTFIGELIAISEENTFFEGECLNRTLDNQTINVFLRWVVARGNEKKYSKVLVSLIDITARKKAENELKNQQEQLELINKILRHDIMNNLAVIKSAIRLFKDNPETRLLNEASASIDKSSDLIMKMREYESMIANAQMKIFDLEQVIKKLMTQYNDINWQIQGSCKIFATDTLESILDNIVSNAMLHGKTKSIEFVINSIKNYCELRIKDNGVGIPDEVKKKIFEEGFHYGKTGNTGLGLHIVKKAVERCDGKIWVEDNEPQGSVFVIHFQRVR